MKTVPSHDVVIAGAGIIGAAIAWHLAEAGRRVCVLDATGPAAAASGASDGAVSVCSKRPGLMAELAQDSLERTRALSAPGGPLAGVFAQRPSFLFAATGAEEAVLDDLARRLTARGGAVRVQADHAAPALAIEGISEAATRLLEVQGEGHMLGYDATARYLAHPRIATSWPSRLEGWQRVSHGLRVETGRGPIDCERLVLAMGTATTELLPEIPLFPRMGQLIVTDRGTGAEPPLKGALTAAAYLMDKTQATASALPRPPVVIDPLHTGQMLIGSSRENHGATDRTDFSTVRRLLDAALDIYPPLATRRVIRVFAGARAAVRDGWPIVGFLPHMPEVFVATGFEGDGICLSALIGHEAANALTGSGINASLAPLAPTRFAAFDATAKANEGLQA